ncbi:lantibiotic ABC transporter permease [Aerococcaceae bacterium zg-BR9]|uniref:hypothetical protein n=1 Tax=Aerococcaceae bacterium zg-1292 TaxID=2774330 RepID=UPI004063E23C|nr:lantibiotic ABC transporter permease [Aerococcaceae bacterium zg-BR9]MBF6977788.1 lantibiotic ABC transporter permease [Aerococcaceae bacterium zg-BR22]
MYNIILSYWLRSKRTPVRLMIILCPLIFSLVYGIYAISTNGLVGKEFDVFFCIYIILANFSISIFIPTVYEIDKSAGNYAQDLRCGLSRTKIFLSKFFYISILLFIIELIAVFIMGLLVFSRVNMEYIRMIIYFMIGLVMLFPMIPMYQCLSLKFGFSGSILVGTFLTLSGILLGTTDLGKIIWYLFPFVWPIKLVFAYTKRDISDYFVLIFLIVSVIITAFFIGVFSSWYNKWDGMNRMEE